MAIARVEINFEIEDGDSLPQWVEKIAEAVVPLLDPHEDHSEECERFWELTVYADVTSEYTEADGSETYANETIGPSGWGNSLN